MRLFDKVVSHNLYTRNGMSPVDICTVLCCDDVYAAASKDAREGRKIEGNYPWPVPPWQPTFIEANAPSDCGEVKQFGGLVYQNSDKVCRRYAADWMDDSGGTKMFVIWPVVNINERIVASPTSVAWIVNDSYEIRDIRPSGESWEAMATGYGAKFFTWSILREITRVALIAFTFANCCNVKFEDVTDDIQPPAKTRRRLKIPEVKRYTLNIAGHAARPSREYDQGPQGMMPFHLCRGHFATYTAEKPMFGNPKLVGRYWHPPHMKGKKENGEVAKDYAIRDAESQNSAAPAL